MARLPRLGGRLPGSVLGTLGLVPGERVIAWGAESPGDPTHTPVVVASDRALYLPALGERLSWDEIVKASWSEPALELTVSDDSGSARMLRVRLDDPHDLPAAVHDRVTASVVVSERLDLGGGAKATAVARRVPGEDRIRWTVVFDAGLDPSDEQLRTAADAELARLRDSLGV